MADVLLPTWLKISRLRTDYRDNTGLTRALYTAAPETTGFGGDRLRMSLEFTPTSSRQSAVERATLRSFLARLRGRQNRAYLWDPSYRGPRGSFPAFELMPSTESAAAWTTSASLYALSATDRTLRARRIANTGSTTNILRNTTAATFVQYAPYVARFFIAGRFSDNVRAVIRDAALTAIVSDAASTALGMRTVAGVVPSTSGHAALSDSSLAGSMAGDFIEAQYASLARCALVDNGINAATQSNALSNAAWSKNELTIGDNILAGPDGVIDADGMTPTTNSAEHRISRTHSKSAVAEDVVMYGVFQDAGYDFIQMALAGGAGSAACTFNVATGAIAVAASASSDWSNARAVVRDMGAGWYLLELIARSAVASYTTTYYVGSGSGTFTFAGNGTSGVRGVLLGNGLSSSFVRPIATTTTAVPTGTSQTGSALQLKGLRAPGEGAASGLLLPDDRFEIRTSHGSEMKIVTAALDSDAAGLGYLQFEPPLIGVPADNAPIIVNTPMTRAIFVGDMVGFSDEPGILTTASAEFEEA